MTHGAASVDAESLVTELERALREEPRPSALTEAELRKRLSKLYLVDLGDPLSAAVHVEALLEGESVDPAVLDAAAALLEHRPIAARIAEKLSVAYGRLGQFANEMGMLTKEMALAKSPRLERVKRRLAELHFERLEDADGALDLLEPLVLRATDDDALRARYLEIAGADAGARAIRTLMRASRAEKDADVRSRLLCDLGELYLKEGEVRRARQALLDAVSGASSDAKALQAAKRLLGLEHDPGDPKVVGAALETIVRLEREPSSRHAAAERLLALPAAADDSRAVLAWRALIDSDRGAEALERLTELLEKKNDVASLIEVLRARGPTRDAQARLIPLLEKAGLWAELASTLERQAALVPDPDSAVLFARLGRTRAARLGDPAGALAAFGRSLELDPKNATSRAALEKMMAEGAHRLPAADILERVYRADGFVDGLARVLVVRAEMTQSPGDKTSALDRAFVASEAAGLPAPRLVTIVEKGLTEAARNDPASVPAWLARFKALASVSNDRAQEASFLVGVLGKRAVDCPELVALACAAIDALVATGQRERAQAVGAASLATAPASIELLERYDQIVGARQDPGERLVRYQAALDGSKDPAARRRFMQIIAAICREDLDDLPRAIELWQRILRDDPQNLDALMGLLSAYERLDNSEALFAEIDQALETFEGEARQALLLKKAAALSKFGEREESSKLREEILRVPNLDNTILEAILTAAYEDDQPEVYREALELQAKTEDPAIRMLALERLGDFHFERLGDRRAAIDSWKPAARLYTKESPQDEHARELYERVLEASPDDREAAWKLMELYARAGDWVRVPEVYGALLRSQDGLEAAIERLLGLERDATRAGAVDDYVSMIDETVPRLATEASQTRYLLMQAKARVLSADPARQAEASIAHRNVIESFGAAPDFEAFESFIESRGSADDRQDDLRWLYEFRVNHSSDAASVLIEWARAEEDYGDVESAIRVYERCLQATPFRRDVLEPLARLKRAAGDFEGCVSALRALRQQAEPERAVELDLSIARLLSSELGRPVEAVDAVARHLGTRRAREALDILRHALRTSDARARALSVIEQSATAADAQTAKVNLELLIEEAGDDSAIAEETRSDWYARLVDRLSDDAGAALDVAAAGVEQIPNAARLWVALEQLARRTDRPERAAEAYRKALERGMSADLGETTGRRIVELLDDSSSDSEEVLRTLGQILEYVPGARWALDRIKLVLSAQGRWSDLFELYDRAVEGSTSQDERVELLNEAAVAARDLGRNPDRAVSYLEQLLELRPGDAPAQSALERLYERNGLTRKLIGLLLRRVENASGLARVELSHRIASAWLDLGDTSSAAKVTDGMLARGASVDDVKDLLERTTAMIADRGTASDTPRDVFDRAVSLLSAHYAASGQTDDLIRLTKMTLLVSSDQVERARSVKDLVRLRLESAYDVDDAFSRTLASVKADVEGDPALVRVAYDSVHDETAKEWQRLKGAPSRDVVQTAWKTIVELADLDFLTGNIERAIAVLKKGAELPFERARTRELRFRIAHALADRANDEGRSISAFRELFEEDAADEIAAASAERFSELLETAGLEHDRAELWEKVGNSSKEPDGRDDARNAWVRAADIWESIGEQDRAIGAYRAAAAFGSNTALEALGRLYSGKGEWRAAADALEWLLAASAGEAKVRCALAVSEAYIGLGERALARTRLAETVAQHPSAQAARAKLLQLYREDSVWKELAELLVDGSKLSADRVERLGLVKEAARINLRELHDHARAAPLLEAAIELDPESVELRLDLGEALDAAGRHQDSVTALREALRIGGEKRSKATIAVHRALARALTHAGRKGEARSELEAAAKLNPADPNTLYELSKLAKEEGALDVSERTLRALLLALHHPAGSTWAGPTRAEVYLDLSQILASRGDTAEAQDLVDSAFDSALNDQEETERIEQELLRRGRHDLVAVAVERRLRAAAGPDASARALAALVSLWEGPLARAEDLRATISRHVEAIGRDAEERGTTDRMVWSTLAKAHAAMGGQAARVDLVKRHVLALTRAAEKEKRATATKLLLEAAHLLADELSDLERAATLLEPLFQKSSGEPEVWDKLRDVSLRLGRRDRLAKLLEGAISSSKPSPERKRLRQELANLLLEAPPQTERAVEILQQILADDPNDGRAIELLAGVLEREGRYQELVELLSSNAGDVEDRDPRAVVAQSMRLARALEGASRPADAGAVYARLLDTDVNREELRIIAERLDEVGSDRLADCVERLAELEVGVEAGRFARRLADLREAKADDAGVLRALTLGFAAHPEDSFFFERLVKAHESAERWDQVATVVDRRLAREPGNRELTQKLVDAYQRSHNPGKALEALDRALAQNGSDADLLRMRAWLHEAEGRLDDALVDLEKAYSLDPSLSDDLITLLAQASAREKGGEARRSLALVDLLLREDRAAEARSVLEDLLARSPNHIAGLERLASVAAADGDWTVAGEACRRLLPLLGGDPSAIARVSLVLADACERRDGLADAKEALERALELVPGSAEIRRRLAKAYETVGERQRLSELLEAEAGDATTGEEKASLLLRSAELILSSGGSPNRALELAEQARNLDPGRPEGLLVHAKAQAALGHADDAIASLRELLKIAKGRGAALVSRAEYDLATLYLQRDEIFEAFDALNHAFNADPKNDEAGFLLGLVAIDLDDERTAARALRTVTTSRSTLSSESKAVAYYHLARIAQLHGDLRRAKLMATNAVAENAGDEKARALLEAL